MRFSIFVFFIALMLTPPALASDAERAAAIAEFRHLYSLTPSRGIVEATHATRKQALAEAEENVSIRKAQRMANLSPRDIAKSDDAVTEIALKKSDEKIGELTGVPRKKSSPAVTTAQPVEDVKQEEKHIEGENPTPVPSSTSSSIHQPDLIAVGGGYFDFNKNQPRDESIDLRVEYRWGTRASLLPMIAPKTFAGWDQYFQLRPQAGFLWNVEGGYYPWAGLVGEFLIGEHFFITPSSAIGLYAHTGGKRMGSVIEFKSQIETGYKFDSGLRLVGFVSHISNAGITQQNPGANTIGGYVQFPAEWLWSGDLF